uniref:Alpha-tubulin N-acetyltransferase n=1 Tax=Angiostrongylus cantonensis TaxID=6313 RepID=A0A0K0D286_ANGCA
MELNYDLSEIFTSEPFQRLDRAKLARFNPRKFWSVQKSIDTLGQLSTEAQGLKRVLTTYEKVLNHAEDQIIYLMWQRHPTKSLSIVIGILKVGRKHLYLLDESQRKFEEEPLCILDFYVHSSVQRRGNGHQLFDYMLKQESISAASIAIDRPSDAFLQFLTKFYDLKKPGWVQVLLIYVGDFI